MIIAPNLDDMDIYTRMSTQNRNTNTHVHTHAYVHTHVYVHTGLGQAVSSLTLVVMCPFLLISSTDKDETGDSDDQNL